MSWVSLLHTFIVSLAVGCADPDPPKYGNVERVGNKAVFSCDYNSDTTWHISCVDDTWKGNMGNCSEGKPLPAVIYL